MEDVREKYVAAEAAAQTEQTAEVIEEFRLPAGVTEELIATWRAKHRKVFAFTVEDDGELFTGVFRRPDMTTMTAVMALVKSDEMRASNTLFDACWLGGDAIIKEDAALKLAMMSRLQTLLEVKVRGVKNL